MTAIVTPFRGGRVDHAALAALVEDQIAGGIEALVACGSTGEAATLSLDELRDVLKSVVAAARGRVPVIAGASASATAEAMARSRLAEEVGVDALLHATPAYNKPPQEGLYQHFRAVVEATSLPVILYNVPGRSACDLLTETVARLTELPTVVALKDATGSIQRGQEHVARIGARVTLLSGEDAINYPLYCVGGRGCISVVSNVAPRLVSDCWRAAKGGDHARARALHAQVVDLAEALFCESNPIPVKFALSVMGRVANELRLPLVPISQRNEERVRAALARNGLG